MKFLLEHIHCDLCGCEKYRLRYRKPDNWLWNSQYEFNVVECLKCGLVYINPRPTQDSIAVYYPNDYHYNRNTDIWRQKYSIELSYLPELTTETILDIGCAMGEFLKYLLQHFPNVKATGIDYFSEGIDSNQIQFIKGLLPECKFGDNKFDFITAWGVLEHLHTPNMYFREISRILKPNGKFIFLVTNSESLYGKKAYIEDIPRHTYHYSEKTLKAYADINNFQFVKCAYDDRVWDGRGTGTFKYLLLKKLGWKWEIEFFKAKTKMQKWGEKIGNTIDRLVFKKHWEAEMKKSGIIICEFIKNEK